MQQALPGLDPLTLPGFGRLYDVPGAAPSELWAASFRTWQALLQHVGLGVVLAAGDVRPLRALLMVLACPLPPPPPRRRLGPRGRRQRHGRQLGRW